MTVRLTDTAMSKNAREMTATEKRRDVADAAMPSLRIRLTPNGGKSWVAGVPDNLGRMRRFPLGAYPTLTPLQAVAWIVSRDIRA